MVETRGVELRAKYACEQKAQKRQAYWEEIEVLTKRSLAGAALALALSFSPALAQKKYDPGASDSEIRLGQTVPHSGPGSLYGVIGRMGEAYFQALNDKGGINGRKIKFFTLDDSYSAPKTVEATRKLVEQDEVLALFGSLGTAPQSAVQKYLNTKKVPQLLLNTGAGRWNDPKNFPWTTSGLLVYPTEGRILARYILQKKPDAKIAILFQNDEFGRDYIKGLKEGLANQSRASIVSEIGYELTEPTVDGQMIKLASSGADVLFNVSTGKATSQSIKKLSEMTWKPLHIVVSTSNGRSILSAAGLDAAKGIVSAQYNKDLGAPRWADDPAVKDFQALREKYLPTVTADNTIAFQAYSMASVMAEILRRCGDNLTRENVMKQATNLKGFAAPAFLPGVTYAFTPEDYSSIKTLYIGTFNGKDWDIADKPISE
jgi:ABC-type branched-subunit amino acid transport system substrate-binding protein